MKRRTSSNMKLLRNIALGAAAVYVISRLAKGATEAVSGFYESDYDGREMPGTDGPAYC